jgi:hypothetical protein
VRTGEIAKPSGGGLDLEIFRFHKACNGRGGDNYNEYSISIAGQDLFV